MINMQEVLETNNMIAHEKLDVRTITMGISLLDCADADRDRMNQKIYEKRNISWRNGSIITIFTSISSK